MNVAWTAVAAMLSNIATSEIAGLVLHASVCMGGGTCDVLQGTQISFVACVGFAV